MDITVTDLSKNTVRCPFCCVTTAKVQKDASKDGIKFSCRHCRLYYNFPELVSRLCGVSVDSALVILRKHGFYKKFNYSAYARRMDWAKQLLQKSVQDFQTSPGTAVMLAQEMNLLSPRKIRVGVNDTNYFVGVVETKSLERQWRDMLGTRKAVFTGKQPKHSLLFPFWDDPSHLSGFYVVGWSGSGPYQRTFLPLLSVRQKCTGLYGLSELAAVPVGGTGVINDSPEIAAALQVRNGLYTMSPLPIVSWLDLPGLEPGEDCWQYLRGFSLVFWGLKFTPLQAYYAMKLNGKISLAGPRTHSPEELAHYFRADAPLHVLRSYVANKARPWPKSLYNWTRSVPANVIDDLVLFLHDRGYDLDLLKQHCNSLWIRDSVKRVKETLADDSVTQPVVINNTMFDRLKDCWYYVKTGKRTLATDFTLDIYEIDIKSGYKGVIAYGGKNFEFFSPSGVYNSGRLKAAIDQAILQHTGKLPICNVNSTTLRQLVAAYSNPIRTEAICQTKAGLHSGA